jgi:hypothetical protein
MRISISTVMLIKEIHMSGRNISEQDGRNGCHLWAQPIRNTRKRYTPPYNESIAD